MAKSVYARLKKIKSAVMLPIEILNRRRAPFESDSDSTVRLLVCESDRFALRPGAPVRAEVREETTNGARGSTLRPENAKTVARSGYSHLVDHRRSELRWRFGVGDRGHATQY